MESHGELTAYDLLLTTVPMFRKTLTILSLLGLLLSVGLWGVSHAVFGWVTSGVESTSAVEFNRGHVHFVWDMEPADGRWRDGYYLGVWGWGTTWAPKYHDSEGFKALIIPLWIPALCFAVYPVYLLTPLHRKRKRKKLGLCVKCGYDLRGSKDRCPECGGGFVS